MAWAAAPFLRMCRTVVEFTLDWMEEPEAKMYTGASP